MARWYAWIARHEEAASWALLTCIVAVILCGGLTICIAMIIKLVARLVSALSLW